MQSISVIIPTYNGGHKLPNLLKALELQTISDFEVIIVCDGSTDNTVEVVTKYPWKLQIQLIVNKNQGRSATRNHGAALAKNEILVFFDDDMRPLPNCLKEHLAHHTQYTNSLVTGGLCEEITNNSSDLYKFKAFLSNKWLSPFRAHTSKLLVDKEIFITTANLSLPKAVFNKIGGFNVALMDAEDFEFGIRAHHADYKIYYRYNAFAWHDDNISINNYIKRQRQYFKAQAKLITLHPDWPGKGIIQAVNVPKGLRALFFRMFCSQLAIKMAEKKWILVFPQALRYKYYDIVITANGMYFPELVHL
jgi:GT2 family glycosyltransferase